MDIQSSQPNPASQPATQPAPIQDPKSNSKYIQIILAGFLVFVLLGLIVFLAYLYLKDSGKEESKTSTDETVETSSSTSMISTTATTTANEGRIVAHLAKTSRRQCQTKQ